MSRQFATFYNGAVQEDDDVLATPTQDGLMSKEDKAKLDSLSEGSGGGGTVESIEASKVIQDASHRFTTDTEKATWNAKASADVATTDKNGLMSKEDKIKLDNVAEGANNYVHPDDANTRHVTDAQIAGWDAKAPNTVVSTSANGLMSKEDKTKLDTVEEGANKYVHPDDENTRHVTDAEKAKWNTPATKETVGLSNVTNDAQVKRSEMGAADGVATLDSSGKIPSAQLPGFVDDVEEAETKEDFPETGESGKLYVETSTNKTYRWSGSQYTEITNGGLALGETSATAYAGDKGKAVADKVTKIEDGTTKVPSAVNADTVGGLTVETAVPVDAKFTDTVYTHPDNHPATMITEDATHRFTTDDEKATWNAKASTDAATAEANGLMSKEDKTKLDGVEAGANKYTHPGTHPATMIEEDENHKFVTSEQIAKWDGLPADKEAIGLGNVTNDAQIKRSEMGTANGVATLDDSGKLTEAQLPDSANTTEVAAKVTKIEDGTTVVPKASDAATVSGFTVGVNVPADAKFTDTTYVKATTEADGLMSKEDKAKLDGVEEGANKYVHPDNHPATMITEDATHRFTTDAEKTKWNTPVTKETVGLGNVTNDAQVKRSEMGVADGVATLDSTGKIPSAQLPGSVDEIIEAENLEAFPPTGESSKIYVDITENKTYRWSGSQYTEISSSIALGETSATAYAGDKGKAVADKVTKIEDGTTKVPSAVNADTVGGLTVETAVPADAKFTDTTYEKATAQADGLMSKEDKNKLDGVEAGANKYTHPDNHPATMITEDETHRFATDTEKAAWNAKASTDVATSEANGLMSKEDKAKLDKLKMVMVINNETLAKNATVTTTVSINTVKYLVVLDNDSIPHGHSIPVYKDKTNGKRFVAKIVDLDVEQLAYTEKVFKFEIVDENTLKYLGGMKITTKDNALTTEAIDENTFYILGMSI